ncbi:MAG: HAD family hydrolase [Thermoplasmata archaeon]
MPVPKPAVTFDLWHTLVYLEPEAEEGYMRHQVEAAVQVLETSQMVGNASRASAEELRAAFEKEYADAVQAAGEGRTVTPAEQLSRAAEATGRVPRPDAYLAALERAVATTAFRQAPDALPVLRELGESGYTIGVISNTIGEPGRFLRPILHRMGFDDLVDQYTFSDEHPWTKPAPEIFDSALRGLDSDPSVAVHVGDGWSDIEGARRARMRGSILFTGLQQYGERYRVLFLPAGWDHPPADHRASALREVVPIVRRLVPTPRNGIR